MLIEKKIIWGNLEESAVALQWIRYLKMKNVLLRHSMKNGWSTSIATLVKNLNERETDHSTNIKSWLYVISPRKASLFKKRVGVGGVCGSGHLAPLKLRNT